MRLAPPRAARAPWYTAPMACTIGQLVARLGGTWLVSVHAGAASPTSERYTALLLGPLNQRLGRGDQQSLIGRGRANTGD